MEKHYYCLFDKVANEYLSLFLANNDKVAIRMLQDSINKNPAHCEDLELFYVCSFSFDYSKVNFSRPIKVASVEISEDNKVSVVSQSEVIK